MARFDSCGHVLHLKYRIAPSPLGGNAYSSPQMQNNIHASRRTAACMTPPDRIRWHCPGCRPKASPHGVSRPLFPCGREYNRLGRRVQVHSAPAAHTATDMGQALRVHRPVGDIVPPSAHDVWTISSLESSGSGVEARLEQAPCCLSFQVSVGVTAEGDGEAKLPSDISTSGYTERHRHPLGQGN
ncbi:hypothetical protein ANO11243_057610 [Dothideomycetidae sp. 11243]|nr:hypothetical protein ANO11243_057610 [fungal sp. No.11243]